MNPWIIQAIRWRVADYEKVKKAAEADGIAVCAFVRQASLRATHSRATDAELEAGDAAEGCGRAE
jgi:hypothetical protein